MELTQLILCIKPSVLGPEDSYIWPLQQSGAHTAKSGYYATLCAEPSNPPLVPNINPTNWKKLVWTPRLHLSSNFSCGRFSMELYQGRESTKERDVSKYTLFSLWSSRNYGSPIFHCQFSQEVWSSIPWDSTFDSSSSPSFVEELTTSDREEKPSPPPTSITINLFPWVCWCIWISRNQLAFENRTATPTDTACKALHAAQEWEIAQSLIKPSAINQAHTSPIFDPPTTFIACNTDGAWKADSLIEGSGWIFRTAWERSVEEESPTSMSPPP